MPRYRLLIEYDGARFAGWQRQSGQTTVQQALEEGLSTVARAEIRLHGSGRTDAGVHAQGQAAHFDTEHDLDATRLVGSINGWLRARHDGAIVILHAEQAPADFHARYDAVRRTYNYLTSSEPRALDRDRRWTIRPEPDWALMNQTAIGLLGEHHFGSFCLTGSATENRVCTLYRAAFVPDCRPGDWRFVIEGNRFLHGMVRAIVGTLVKVGQGRIPPGRLTGILEARDRSAAGPAAPPHALVLTEVVYPDGFGADLAHRV